MLIKMLVADATCPPLIQIFVVVALFCSFAFFGTVSLETSIKLVNPDYI